MALNPNSTYPGQTAPGTPEYPYGSAENDTVPGDGTGTPLERSWVNDLFGLQQSLLSRFGVAPTNSPDEVGASQYFQMLSMLASGGAEQYDEVGAINAYELVPVSGGEFPDAYFEGMRVQFTPSVTNTGPSTIFIGALGVVNIVEREILTPTALTAGALQGGIPTVLQYDAGFGAFVLVKFENRVRRVVYAASGVYTPSAGTRQLFVEVQGAGGGGGGADNPGPNNVTCGEGGGGGAYETRLVQRSALGPSPITVVVGAGGAGGSAAGSVGAAGTASSFQMAVPITAAGGFGGNGDITPKNAPSRGITGAGGAGIATGGAGSISGQPGHIGTVFGINGIGGAGGDSAMGMGSPGVAENSTPTNGGFGAGGAGGCAKGNGGGQAGSNGGNGLVIIWEFFE